MSRSFVFSFFLAGFVLTAQEPNATAILRQVAQTYKEMKSQAVEATMVLDMKSNSMRIEIPVTGATARPGKLRFEVNNPMTGTETISDGRNTWKYVARLQQYTKKPVSPGIFPMNDGPGDILAGENVLDRLQSAKLLRQESLSVDGKDVDCDVIEAEYSPRQGDPPGDQPRQEGPKTLWVDKHRGVILKTASVLRINPSGAGVPLEISQAITITSIRLNQPLPESLFAFVPPEGTREVDELMPVGSKNQATRE